MGQVTIGGHEYDQLYEEGEYTFHFISLNEKCDDQVFTIQVGSECETDIGEVCQSINDAASGNGNWNGSFVSDGNGVLSFAFQTFTVPDQLIVYKNGEEVLNSQPYSSYLSTIQANIDYPNCDVIGGGRSSIYG